jgi:hypothetical protein
MDSIKDQRIDAREQICQGTWMAQAVTMLIIMGVNVSPAPTKEDINAVVRNVALYELYLV